MPESKASKAAQRAQLLAKRPSTWFVSTSVTSPALAAVKTPTEQVNPFHAPPTSFRSPHSSLKGKHKLSPSPSPSQHDYEYVLSPGDRPPLLTAAATPSRFSDPSCDSSSSPMGDSPTPACASASSGKLRFVDPDESPIRHVPGHSRSLAAARERTSSDDLFSPNSRSRSPGMRSPCGLFMEDKSAPTFQAPPPPVFQPIRSSQSQDCNPWRIQRQTRNLRSRDKTTTSSNSGSSLSQQKKAVSLGDMQVDKIDEPFGPAFLHARKARSSMPVTHGTRNERNHRRTPGDSSMSRSAGQKSGLSLSMLSPRTDYTASSSSISSLSSSSLTPPMSAEAVFENTKPMFADVKPNPEVFEAAVGFKQKFKPRDSISSNEGDRVLMPPPSVVRVGTLPKGNTAVKRARSLGHRPDNTPVDLMGESLASKFDFVVNGVSSFAFHNDEKPVMPNTPVKRQAFAHSRMATSYSQPALGSDVSAVFAPTIPPPPSVSKPVPPSTRKATNGAVPQVTVTATSSPDGGMAIDASSSPTAAVKLPQPNPRLSLLRRISSKGDLEGSEDEVTPTKAGRECLAPTPTARIMTTPTPSPRRARAGSSAAAMPRLSLPTVEEDENNKAKRRLAHRQSHPLAPINIPDEEDIFDKRFVTLGPLGRGAFSSVLQVQERNGTGIYAVKRTRGVFNGVKDRWVTPCDTFTDCRLMHLEEVDILRHLSNPANDHVLKFVDAWEQNRQLYIQTEACVGSLAAFLEIYGQTNERLDEGRVWKIARDIADGVRHIHSHGVIHFDIKPDNILIAEDRSLKIADFGFATRWPRISPAEIIAGSGLGGSIGDMAMSQEKLHREGDKTYMPPEMLRGVFVMAADVFSFGLVVFETALNIYLPTGGPSWQALRENNFDFLDLSSLSPELSDFITDCLNAEPELRPTADQIVEHPVLKRAWSGGPAVCPEDTSWLASILGGQVATPAIESAPLDGVDGEGDVIMSD